MRLCEQGLRWCVARERTGDAVGRGHLHLHPAWLQLLTPDKQLIYLSIMPPHHITSDFITAPTGGTCGGTPLPLCLLVFLLQFTLNHGSW